MGTFDEQPWGTWVSVVIPFEVLTDNGKQFTGGFTRPLPVEVLFERTCRELGITQKLTKRKSPTTTGKVERWHQSLRRELLDEAGAFTDLAAAQQAIDGWVHSYMRIQGNLIHAISNGHLAKTLPSPIPAARSSEPAGPPTLYLRHHRRAPITVQRRVPRDGVTMVANQRLRVGRTYAGKTVTVVVEDTHFRIFDGPTELAVHPRTSTKWTRIYKAGVRQNPSSMSR